MRADNIRKFRNAKGLSMEQVREITGLSKSTISDSENPNGNPTEKTLQKLAEVYGVDVEYFYIEDDKSTNKKIPEEFSTPEEAMQFILKENTIMGFGGFDVNKMSDEEVVEFANELLNQLRLISYKYKK